MSTTVQLWAPEYLDHQGMEACFFFHFLKNDNIWRADKY